MTDGQADSLVLLLDTSIQGVMAGLVHTGLEGDAALQWWQVHPENAGSLAGISALVESGLRHVGADRADLAGILVAHGPGSFTGIKVGLAYAYGLLAGLRAARQRQRLTMPRISSVSALEEAARVMAAGQPGGRPCSVAVLVPATRTHGFAGLAGPDGAASRLVDSGNHIELNEIIGKYNITTLAGNWPLLVKACVAQGLTPPQSLQMPELFQFVIRGMRETCLTRWPDGFGEDLPEPRYHRLSTAQEKIAPG